MSALFWWDSVEDQLAPVDTKLRMQTHLSHTRFNFKD